MCSYKYANTEAFIKKRAFLNAPPNSKDEHTTGPVKTTTFEGVRTSELYT